MVRRNLGSCKKNVSEYFERFANELCIAFEPVAESPPYCAKKNYQDRVLYSFVLKRFVHFRIGKMSARLRRLWNNGNLSIKGTVRPD